MSRTLKRVPLNFSWPRGQIWGGYKNPYHQLSGKCPGCEHGYDRIRGRPDANAALFKDQWYGNAPFDPFAYGAESAPLTREHPAFQLAARNIKSAPDFYMADADKIARWKQRERIQREEGIHVIEPTFIPQIAIAREAQRLFELWRDQWCHHLIQADVDALVAADRLWDFTRRPLNEEQAQKLRDQEARGGSGFWLEEPNGHHPTAAEVNAWSFEGFGHDGINQGTCVKARCAREGVPYECVRCHGSGAIWPTPKIEQQYETWEKTDPPTGNGYQLWEDCSEGSPVSPVFASLDELCAWAEENATTFADFKATAEEWREMLEDDCVHAHVGGDIFT